MDSTLPRGPSPGSIGFADSGRCLLKAGQLVGNYRLAGRIGRGGMGEVYSAVHQYLERPAAIKVLYPELSRIPEVARRFLDEGRAVTLVRHPGVVEVYEFGVLPDGMSYIAMELLEGQTMSSYLEGTQLAPLPLVQGVTAQLAQAMAAAHELGIVHRDLKPDNVMVLSCPELPVGVRTKILDFGLAKIAAPAFRDSHCATHAGARLGTPAYMAPEQCIDGAAVDGKADVYALGIILYEMLAGRRPFEAELSFEVMAMHVRSTPPPLPERTPPAPPALRALLAEMLAKDPALRPTMASVSERLAALLLGGERWAPDLRWTPRPEVEPASIGQLPTLLEPLEQGRQPRVLVVDDQADYAEALAEVLADEGYSCRVLQSGDAVREAVRSFRPDLVLLDVELPGASGFRLCWQIKTTPETQHVPVALISAKVGEVDHKLGAAVLADAYVDKPRGVPDLLATVRELLGQSAEVPVAAPAVSPGPAGALPELLRR